MITIVIPAYNNSYLTAMILNDLAPVSSEYEIVLVDDGSNDDTAKVVQQFLGRVKYACHSKNLGLPYAWNTGISYSTGDPIIFLNNDVRVHYLEALDVLARATEDKYIVGPVIRAENPLTVFRGQHLQYVDGWCFAVPRKIFDDIGKFDTDFAPGSFEDAEFCQRALANGYELKAVPELLGMMVHAKSKTFSKYHNMDELNKRNREIFLTKMETLWGIGSAFRS